MKISFTQILAVFAVAPGIDAFAGFPVSGSGLSRQLVSLQGTSPSSSQSSNTASELSIQSVRKAISSLKSENFSDTLLMVEPFLLDKAGASFYKKSMNRIKRSAKALDLKIPDRFAKEAKATVKSRARQEAFIQKKEAEAEAAAAASQEVTA
jgi:hypothetical protein